MLFYFSFFCSFPLEIKAFVIQSEAKNLGSIKWVLP